MTEQTPAEPIKLTNLHEWAWRTYHQLQDRGDLWRGDPGIRDVLSLARPSLRDPIFVVGAPRSGTSFLGFAIGEVPGVSYHHEPIATKNAVRYVHHDRWTTWWARRFYKTVYRWLLRFTGEAGLRFAEKTPRNSLIIPFLAETFADARFVHIIRDGRDATVSLASKPWLSEGGTPESEQYPLPRGPYPRCWVEPERREEFRKTSDVHRCIWSWRSHVEHARRAGASLPPNRYLEIRYEDMPKQPDGIAEQLSMFLEFDETSERVLSRELASAHAGSIGRWRDAFTDEDRDVIEREAGDLLGELDYTWE